MTIAKGEPWGEIVTRPDEIAVATTDAELAAFVVAGGDRAIGVSGGDVHTFLGRPAGRGPMAQSLPMDAIHVALDADRRHVAVAHVVLRNGWWRGRIVAIMNVSRLGAWDVAPSGHPNDGRAELVEAAASMGVRERWAARRRLPTGTHIPHPSITIRHLAHGEVRFERPVDVFVDGVPRGTAVEVAFRVEPDAYRLTC